MPVRLRAGRRPAAAPSPSSSTASTRSERDQVLLGVTGSGKTFTMAKVIEETQRPALILAPNKTLAAQLYGEFKSLLPRQRGRVLRLLLRLLPAGGLRAAHRTPISRRNRSINEQIDRMRHSATRALLERDDVIIVASVSCIYGIGSVETYTAMTFSHEGRRAHRAAPAHRRPRRAAIQAHPDATSRAAPSACAATSSSSSRPTSRTAPGASALFGDEVESIVEFDPLTGKKIDDLQFVKVYANSHYVTPRADAAAGDQGHQGRAAAAASTELDAAWAACSRRSGSSSAAPSTSR